MRILRVISSVNPAAGGPINGLISSTRELEKMGFVVEVATLDDPQASWLKDFEFPLITFRSFVGGYSYSPGFQRWINENVKNYDVVIVHGLWQFHSFATASACKLNGVPYLTFVHGMLDPWFNRVSKLKALKKKIYWAFLERHVINCSAAVLFTSEEEKTLARGSFSPYLPVERVVAYGSPIPMVNARVVRDKFLFKFDLLKGKRFALFLSRIHKKKGLDLLIDALGRIGDLPGDFMLAIAGPDNNGLQGRLTKKIESLGLTDRVIWLGMLSGELKWGAYHAADVFVLPSHQENFGIVVAESLSTGTPVLITNKVNIWREIKVVGAGFVENDDVIGIESLLEKWLALDPVEKQLMSERAEACYKNNFSIESAAYDLGRVVSDVLCDGALA